MKNPLTLLIGFATLPLLFSCSKDEDADTGSSKTELITAGTWKFSSATSSGFDVSGFLDACQKDNTILFRADGNATLDEGSTRCDPGDPQTISFGWNFTAGEAGGPCVHAAV